MKRAEKREPKPKNAMEGIPGMSAYQHLGGHPGYGVGQFPQQGTFTVYLTIVEVIVHTRRLE